MRRGLVLEGGGARGAYQVGAYLALLELGYEFDAIVGTSIGALNGAMFAAKMPHRAMDTWRRFSFADVFTEEETKAEHEDFLHSAISRIEKLKNGLKDVGYSERPLFEIADICVDEDAIRSSGIDFGICTVNVTDRRVEKLMLSDMPKGSVKGYVVASCYLPIFKLKPIRGKYYLDGGFASQAPIDMIEKLGLSPVVIRLHNLKMMDDFKNAELVIEPKKSLGKILDFDPVYADNLIRLGYFDAHRAVRNLRGEEYYIEDVKESDALKFLIDIMDRKDRPEILKKAIEDIPKLAKEFGLKENWDFRELLFKVLERDARAKNIEKFRIYSVKELMEELGYGF